MSTTPPIIGLTGPAGCGKDTVADILQAELGAGRLAFADALRAELARAFGVDQRLFFDRDIKELPTPSLALAYCNAGAFAMCIGALHFPGQRMHDVLRAPRSPRQIMQWWGTDFRRRIDNDYWVNKAVSAVRYAQADRPGAPIVITDVRFDNEAAMVRGMGGVIWQIARPGCAVADGAHASETTGAAFAPGALIDNRFDVAHLRAQVRLALGLGQAQEAVA